MFATLLGSAVIAAFVSKMTVENTNKLKYITGERQKWRDDIREGMIGLRRLKNFPSDSKIFKDYTEAESFFALRFNPKKSFDNKVLGKVKELNRNNNLAINLNCIEENLQNLLKNDWEKSKWEASPKLSYKLFNIIIFLGILYLDYNFFLEDLLLKYYYHHIIFSDLFNEILLMILIDVFIILILKCFIDSIRTRGYEKLKFKWLEMLLSYLGIFKTLKFKGLETNDSNNGSDIG